MKKNFKKIIAVLLSVVLTFGCIPMVFAEGEEEPVIITDGYFDYKIVTPDEGEPYAELVKYTGDEAYVSIPGELGGVILKVIGHEAFDSNTNLNTVSVAYGIEVIDSRAFCNCINLSRVMLPESVKEIGDYAFVGCYNKQTDEETGEVIETETGLAYLHIPSSLVRIGDSAFQGCELFTGNAVIPSNVTGDTEAPALILPTSLRELGADAFSQCRSLVNVFIPEGVTDIRTGTFTNCASLERVEIPSTVTHIGAAFNGAFKGHNRLSEYEPMLIIKAPHCVIVDSPDMDLHVIVHGAEHSSVQAYVDKINKEREDNFYKDYSDFTGIEPDIDYMTFVAISVPNHDFYGTITEPTCTERGYTTYICSQCEAAGYYDDPELTDVYVPHVCEYTLPAGHRYGDWSEILAPGCETIGSKHRVCTVCNYTDYRQVPPTGHNYVFRDTTTCTSSGQRWNECTRCHSKKNIEAYKPYGHEFNYDAPDYVISLVACNGDPNAETVDGLYVYICRRKNYNPTTGVYEECGCTQRVIEKAHPDENNDFYCDLCGKYIGTSDSTDDKSCTCDCHTQVGFFAWFYKIKLFFWKLFGVNKVCDCGVLHY